MGKMKNEKNEFNSAFLTNNIHAKGQVKWLALQILYASNFLRHCVGRELFSFLLRVSATENIEMGWCVLYKHWQRRVGRVMAIQSTLGNLDPGLVNLGR